MSGFTPGPWVARFNGYYWEVHPVKVSGLDGVPWTVASICPSDPENKTGLQEANSRLIAAAPDLLDVARKAVLFLRSAGFEPVAGSSHPAEALLSLALNAVASAGGDE